MTYDAVTVPTPFGAFTAIAEGGTVVGSGFIAGADELRDRLPDPRGEIRVRAELGEISSALDVYFTGTDVTALDRLPVRMEGSPPCAGSGTSCGGSPPERFAATPSWEATAAMRGLPAPRARAIPSR